MKLIICALLVLATTGVIAQELRTRTSDVHLAVNQPRSLTTVPSIKWISPNLEYTNSVTPDIEIEAVVFLGVAIKSI